RRNSVHRCIERGVPAAGEERCLIQICAAQISRYLANEDVVLDEASARRVGDRRSVRKALRDDPVTGFGDDDVTRGQEIFVAKSGGIHRRLVNEARSGRELWRAGIACENDVPLARAVEATEVDTVRAVDAE